VLRHEPSEISAPVARSGDQLRERIQPVGLDDIHLSAARNPRDELPPRSANGKAAGGDAAVE